MNSYASIASRAMNINTHESTDRRLVFELTGHKLNLDGRFDIKEKIKDEPKFDPSGVSTRRSLVVKSAKRHSLGFRKSIFSEKSSNSGITYDNNFSDESYSESSSEEEDVKPKTQNQLKRLYLI
jgi:hypothetical protein